MMEEQEVRTALVQTLAVVLASFLIDAGIGLVAGIVMGLNRTLRDANRKSAGTCARKACPIAWLGRSWRARSRPPGHDDGWPPGPEDYVVGAVIGHVRCLVGNGLSADHGSRLLEGLLQLYFDQAKIDEATAEMGDVMVVTVAAAPAGFPLIESDVSHEYEYGMTLEEVTLGFDADIEVPLPTWAAKPLLDSGTATVVEQDRDWAVIAVPGVEMQCTAHLRVEYEDAEITELWISLRED